jgi:hypothetical protein
VQLATSEDYNRHMKKNTPMAHLPEYAAVHDLVALDRGSVRAIYTKAIPELGDKTNERTERLVYVLTQDTDKRCNVRVVGTNLVFNVHKGYLVHPESRTCLSWDLVRTVQRDCLTSCEFHRVSKKTLHWGDTDPKYKALEKTFFGCLKLNERELCRCFNSPILLCFRNAKTGKLQFLCNEHYEAIVRCDDVFLSENPRYRAFRKFKKTVARYQDNFRVSHLFREVGIYMCNPMYHEDCLDARTITQSRIFNDASTFTIEDE